MALFSLFKRNKKSSITLRQELWFAILMVILVGFISSLLISTYSAKVYFSSQLYLKNVDNANSLALMVSQLDKDPVSLELLISATFDTGHYQRIELQNPAGEVIVKREFSGDFDTSTPDWFHHLYHLNVAPGVSQINDGWSQFGTVYLESHSQYTEQALWQSAVRLFFSFLIVAIVACIASSYFLSKILRPLDDVVYQANELGNKRFIKSKVPNTYEFARLVSSMNLLSARFSKIIKEDNKRLEEFRFKSQHDELTGLANREYFSATLEAQLKQSEDHAHGALFLFRVMNLDQISEQLGRVEMVNFVRRFTKTLILFLEENEDRFSENHIARMSHTDFTVLFTDVEDLQLLSDRVLRLHKTLVSEYQSVDLALPHSCTFIESKDTRFTLLKRVDDLLKIASSDKSTQAKFTDNKNKNELFDSADSWRSAIEKALDNDDLDVMLYPVTSFSGKLLHNQLTLNLLLNGELYRSGFYYQWAKRLKLLARLDWGIIKYLVRVFDEREDLKLISVEISEETLLDDSALAAILTYLLAFPNLAKHICFDVKESIAVAELAVFRDFCGQVNSMGAKVSLKRVGSAFTKLDKLQELGLEMIKIDSIYGHKISYSQDNQTFLRGMCAMAHSLGIKVIAEGVSNPDDLAMLQSLGFDGVVSQPVDAAGMERKK
ncbi:MULTISPECIES: LapD/MoxY N-terminal periplasmic domain-containing protein [unclassified Pseudoalteromonas]|uniref:bifunctional diguanylate cyclase/phosphodiesterase n=1 Tax=unclassified Pseudoalteromonas TaxID=194690 RepID=UPI0025B5F463|nr:MULTISPECIES: LapD/MoxY N-terminal periplasmic domain-containing protein [unclassified Pseudoalteromonas]MDN3379326.1 LapD/MoxY N-terminal periplasmic domain-containing protein [Pseudoalteromonas sp. APC 3893]MDN3386500.1 LapD/MoxY N-terminal periplasmic domain-containing protein [Pseudoalteromonas sp. APC 4017]